MSKMNLQDLVQKLEAKALVNLEQGDQEILKAMIPLYSQVNEIISRKNKKIVKSLKPIASPQH